MRTPILLAIAALATAEAASAQQATRRPRAAAADTMPVPATTRFDALVRRHVEERARRSPEWATSVGLHDWDPLLDDRRATAHAADSAAWAALGDSLAAIDTAALDERRRVDWLLLRGAVRGRVNDAGVREWERRPASYIPFSAVYSLAVGDVPAARTRFTNIAIRLEGWRTAMAQGRAQLDPARVPRLWVENDIRSAEGIARWMDGELVGRAEQAKMRTDRFDAAFDDARRALFEYTRWLRTEVLPRAKGDWKYGQAAYDRRLKEAKLLDESATSLIAMGREVFAETERQLREVALTIDSTRTWRQLLDSAKSLHPSRDSVFAAYSAEARRARQFIVRKKMYTLPPGERLDMVLTPPHLRGTYAYGGYDAAAPFEPRQVGRFFVTPVEPTASAEQVESKLRGHNYGWITVVAVHEGYPGHHLQYVRAARNPNLVRRLYGSEVFGEGWGLYSEEAMYQAGFFPDSLSRLVLLQARLWRAARVIIDPSLHTGKMTFDQAVGFFVDSVGLERADAVAEVTRYTTWPTQAPSYILGLRTMLWLRLQAERRAEQRGQLFDLAKFHDRVLAAGSLPPALLQRVVLPPDTTAARADTARAAAAPSPRGRGGPFVDELSLTAFDDGARNGTTITILPAKPVPGALVRVRVRADGADTVTGTLAGERLHFIREKTGRAAGSWLALGGIPLDSAASAELRLNAGSGDTTLAVRLGPPPYRKETLRVAPQFGTEPDSALAARMEDESRRAREVSTAAHDTPRLWSMPFAMPRPGRVTSPFGTARTFNGQVKSRHLGTDFAGATGTPIKAVNKGVVRLVDRFYLGGNIAYVDHGAGLVTAYLHMSKVNVAVGDTVRRGDVIGRVGSTGRVTGPHLHLIVRYGALTVDPMTLLGPLGTGTPAPKKTPGRPLKKR